MATPTVPTLGRRRRGRLLALGLGGYLGLCIGTGLGGELGLIGGVVGGGVAVTLGLLAGELIWKHRHPGAHLSPGEPRPFTFTERLACTFAVAHLYRRQPLERGPRLHRHRPGADPAGHDRSRSTLPDEVSIR